MLFPAIFLALSAKTPTFALAKTDALMRKFLFSLVSLLVFSALISGSLSGCKTDDKTSDTLSDTTVVKSTLKSAEQDLDQALDEVTVTGTVVDGSQNMVIVETQNGENIEFNYISDNYQPGDIYDWTWMRTTR